MAPEIWVELGHWESPLFTRSIASIIRHFSISFLGENVFWPRPSIRTPPTTRLPPNSSPLLKINIKYKYMYASHLLFMRNTYEWIGNPHPSKKNDKFPKILYIFSLFVCCQVGPSCHCSPPFISRLLFLFCSSTEFIHPVSCFPPPGQCFSLYNFALCPVRFSLAKCANHWEGAMRGDGRAKWPISHLTVCPPPFCILIGLYHRGPPFHPYHINHRPIFEIALSSGRKSRWATNQPTVNGLPQGAGGRPTPIPLPPQWGTVFWARERGNGWKVNHRCSVLLWGKLAIAGVTWPGAPKHHSGNGG